MIYNFRNRQTNIHINIKTGRSHIFLKGENAKARLKLLKNWKVSNLGAKIQTYLQLLRIAQKVLKLKISNLGAKIQTYLSIDFYDTQI